MSAGRSFAGLPRGPQRIDPELLDGLATSLASCLPDGPLTVEMVREVDARTARPVVLDDTPITLIPRTDGGDLELRIHRGADEEAAVLWIHGGGMFLGSARHDDGLCRALAAETRATVVAVDYRLAPEHPYPAALDDSFAALEWMATRYARIVVVGASAGGGLAAGLALRARDRGGPAIAAQHLYYPMLDDQPASHSAGRLVDAPVWSRRLNNLGWVSYLRGRPADAYAAPARATDLAGLPPTYLDTGELDLFRDEDLAYGCRLAQADVPVEMHLDRGAVHAFDLIAPDSSLSRAARTRRIAALLRDLSGPR